jgi:hypothetical protein
MHELTPQSTAAPATPPVPPGVPPIPPEMDPPEAPPAVPPIIDPRKHEAFPTFRETFMVYFTDPAANATVRAFGTLLYDFLLNSWGDWPEHPEGIFRASLRAVVADLRCAQGSLLELTGEAFSPQTPQEGHLASIGHQIAHEVGRLADRFEQELGPWRGEM